MCIFRLLAGSLNFLSAKVSFQEADFFAFSVPKEELFDLVYDYTSVSLKAFPNFYNIHLGRFFVAIPPSKRADWGRQINALVKPGGFLITLVFPLDPPRDYGQPFFVRPEHYIEPLGRQNWEKVIDKIPESSSEHHVGRERLVVWRKLEL